MSALKLGVGRFSDLRQSCGSMRTPMASCSDFQIPIPTIIFLWISLYVFFVFAV
jgi:hypothetical protein